MNTSNTNTQTAVKTVDTLTHDFVVSSLIVSVVVNLTVFVSWLAITLA